MSNSVLRRRAAWAFEAAYRPPHPRATVIARKGHGSPAPPRLPSGSSGSWCVKLSRGFREPHVSAGPKMLLAAQRTAHSGSDLGQSIDALGVDRGGNLTTRTWTADH